MLHADLQNAGAARRSSMQAVKAALAVEHIHIWRGYLRSKNDKSTKERREKNISRESRTFLVSSTTGTRLLREGLATVLPEAGGKAGASVLFVLRARPVPIELVFSGEVNVDKGAA